ncbi:hypothetical protein [Yoonia sp.]|uniref:hypothetical protein n=1 Tax=Yoonia sp. TaxID=2212373 RepID=UPI00391CC5F1
MDYLTNRLTFTSLPAAGRAKSWLADIMAAVDRLEAAIGVARAREARRTPASVDMQTLGFREL